jgi:hypothetical protein
MACCAFLFAPFLKGPAVAEPETPSVAERRRENGRLGGIKSQSAEVLAGKIARDWPALTETQKTIVRTMLNPVLRQSTRKAS